MRRSVNAVMGISCMVDEAKPPTEAASNPKRMPHLDHHAQYGVGEFALSVLLVGDVKGGNNAGSYQQSLHQRSSASGNDRALNDRYVLLCEIDVVQIELGHSQIQLRTLGLKYRQHQASRRAGRRSAGIDWG
jgi:hypothetical protein